MGEVERRVVPGRGGLFSGRGGLCRSLKRWAVPFSGRSGSFSLGDMVGRVQGEVVGRSLGEVGRSLGWMGRSL